MFPMRRPSHKDTKMPQSFLITEQVARYLKMDSLHLPSGDQKKLPASAWASNGAFERKMLEHWL
jgi:hypothetical protein